MLAINWKTSWPLVESAIAAHNAGHVIGTKKNGSPKYDLNKVLRTPHQHLLKEMVRMYSKQLADYKWLHISAILPPYHTNCVSLGKAMNLCKATIHNQLQRLLASGLVIQKEHRGRHNNFTLRFPESIIAIHPELILRRQTGNEGRPCLQADIQPLGKAVANCLGQVPDALSFQKENKRSVLLVENEVRRAIGIALDTGAEASDAACGGLISTGDARLQEASEGEGTGRGKIGKTALSRHEETRVQDSGMRGAVAARHAPAPVSGYFEEHYARLLTLIVGTLYAGLDFMAKSQVDAIKGFIHGQFEGKTREQGEETYREIWMRVGIAEKWLRKKPGRYIPLPYIYFASGNLNGFGRTAEWLANMRLTNERAERMKKRFQYVTKAIGAVLQSTGRHLEENNIHSYTLCRKEVTDKYRHLGTAFDWIVLDPRCNQAGEN